MAGSAIGEVVAFGLGVALSPAATIAVVLMVVKPGGRIGATVFVASWLASLTIVATLTLLLADGADAGRSDGPADWVIAVQTALGLLLVYVAITQWRQRGRDEPNDGLPAWMKKVDGLTPRRAAVMAVVLAAVKPKNLILTIGAAIAVAELGVSPGAQAAGVAAFLILGTLAPGLPLAVSVLTRERGAVFLESAKSWMVSENHTIVAVLCLVFAAKLLGGALSAVGD